MLIFHKTLCYFPELANTIILRYGFFEHEYNGWFRTNVYWPVIWVTEQLDEESFGLASSGIIGGPGLDLGGGVLSCTDLTCPTSTHLVPIGIGYRELGKLNTLNWHLLGFVPCSQ